MFIFLVCSFTNVDVEPPRLDGHSVRKMTCVVDKFFCILSQDISNINYKLQLQIAMNIDSYFVY